MYTFGAPRVGNHAFARDINERVPQLWNVINDQARAAPCHPWPLAAISAVLPLHFSRQPACVARLAHFALRIEAINPDALQDTVPRSGKFLFMYKRPGQRVLINSDGDILVRF